MRVAYVSADPGVPVFGRKGCSVHVQEVVRTLLRQGAQVDLFARRIGGVAPAGLEGVNVHALPAVFPADDSAQREQSALSANACLHELLKCHGPYDAVYERYSLWSFAAMEYAAAHRTPGILEVNAPLIEEQAVHRELVDRRAAEDVADRVFGSATVLAAVSDGVAGYLEALPSARGRVHVFPNGVDPERFAAARRRRETAGVDTFHVGFLGSLRPWHGLSVLVEAFEILHERDPGYRLLVVGDGPEGPRLFEDLAARGLTDAAHLTGAVAPLEVPDWVASMDVGVAPYPSLANFYFSPLKAYEYMAAGLPVVASRIGQLEGLITDRRNGLLCTPGDPRALAGAIDELRRDPELRLRIGQAARNMVVENHTWDAVVRAILGRAGVDAPAQSRSAGRR